MVAAPVQRKRHHRPSRKHNRQKYPSNPRTIHRQPPIVREHSLYIYRRQTVTFPFCRYNRNRMPAKKSPSRKPTRKAQTVAAAEALLRERGLTGVTTRAVAEAVPCSEGAI